MTLSNLYFKGCFEPLSEEQQAALEEEGVVGKVVDKSCSREDINTCGKSIEELFSTYSIYNPQKGLYKSWGDIEFPWQISELTPNLLISQTDDKWKVAQYRAVIAYPQGSKVLVIEKDGYRVSLYEAVEDIVAMSWAFDPSKWVKICHVDTTIPAGLPSTTELLELYKFYSLRLFNTEWGEYNEGWGEGLKEASLSSCLSQGLSFADFEKCLRNNSSDEWKEARVRRDFFYREGEMFLSYSPCEDVLCLYITTQDLPATEKNFEAYKSFNPNAVFGLTEDDKKTPLWQKIYCVSTSRNKCLEYQRKNFPELGYDVVQIGSKGHFVEAPIPYRLSPPLPNLEELTERSLTPPPRVLTQDEIDLLSPPTSPSE